MGSNFATEDEPFSTCKQSFTHPAFHLRPVEVVRCHLASVGIPHGLSKPVRGSQLILKSVRTGGEAIKLSLTFIW